ncbi:tRNA wybutosine-synthesizing protein 2 homolog isoform X2 [Gouania willdenowi]|uniref:tRNA wybutosine-synthesizing protein 2 homolog isoform X2 n=1 Tax=Gouania willdenowi TaxID=441366 RepID=UPI00105487DF|nr:tRNA wybutosine-synthesizing protein 2 homolog isoform X2 [Gouania willdenowi]
MDGVYCLRVNRRQTQDFRKCLQSKGLLDGSLSLVKDSDGFVLLPLTLSTVSQLDLHALQTTMGSNDACQLVWTQTPPPCSKRKGGKRSCNKLEGLLQELLESHGERWSEEIKEDLPLSFQRHGDLVLIGDNTFCLSLWKKMGEDLWSTVAKGLGAKRLAKQGRVSRDGFRTPEVTMLLGEDSWVTHVDNGISYQFDVTKCMFSSGNITEKLRVAAFDCTGETVVDLYAGIGYFTLPYLMHANACHVHACEWNLEAVKALQKNLNVNGVSNRCTVYQGDNRQLCDVADRVNLGLIPSSEEGWPVACRLLKRTTGGVLHIHQNVTSQLQARHDVPQGLSGKRADRRAWQEWANETAEKIASLLKDVTGGQWTTNIQHIERVKSYAPHVHHLVLDLECRPS